MSDDPDAPKGYGAMKDDPTAQALKNVVKLQLVEVGDGYRFEADDLLEKAKGAGFTNLVIIGELPDGAPLWVSAMGNAGQAFILMERAKLQIIGK